MYNFWKARPQKFGRAKKRPNFCAISDNFRLWSRICPELIDIIEHLKKTSSSTTVSTLGKKTLVNFGPQTKKFYWLILTNQRTYFSGDYISAIRGCCALKFLNVLEIDQGYLAHTQAGTGVPPQKKINPENLKLGLKFNVEPQ